MPPRGGENSISCSFGNVWQNCMLATPLEGWRPQHFDEKLEPTHPFNFLMISISSGGSKGACQGGTPLLLGA